MIDVQQLDVKSGNVGRIALIVIEGELHRTAQKSAFRR